MNEPIRVCIRQRPQHDAVEHGEDGRRRAESQHERDERDHRERRRAAASDRSAWRVSRDARVFDDFHSVPPLSHCQVDVLHLASVGLVVAESSLRLALGVRASEVFARSINSSTRPSR